MSDTGPRISRPGITIDEHDRWWNSTAQIINADVLAYFKRNLHRTDDGAYYILNRFGELREHGFLDAVRGFPILIETIWIATRTFAGNDAVESAIRNYEMAAK